MTNEIRFQFIASGDTASYRVLAYSEPYHNKRIELRSRIPEMYYGDGVTRRYNCTEQEFARDIVPVVGYLHFEFNSGELLPLEVAHAFNEYSKQEWQRAKDKYTDFVQEWERPVKGTARYICKQTGEFEFEGLGWELHDLEN